MKLAQLTDAQSKSSLVRKASGVGFLTLIFIYRERQEREQKSAKHQHVTTDDKNKQKSY